MFGKPVGQPRPRARRFGDRVIIYDPKTAEPWRKDIAEAVEVEMERIELPLLTGPLKMNVEFYFSRPKSHFRTGKNAHLLKTSAPCYHTQKPDADNLFKAAADAVNDILYHDDRQIVEAHVSKHWVESSTLEGMQLSVSPA